MFVLSHADIKLFTYIVKIVTFKKQLNKYLLFILFKNIVIVNISLL